MSQQLIGLCMVQRVNQELVSEMDLDQLLKHILRSAVESVPGEVGALLLLDQTGQDLIFSVVEGGGGEALQGQRFDEDDLSLLTAFAAQSAIAIENTRLHQDLRRERDRLIAVEDEVRKSLARELHAGHLRHSSGGRRQCAQARRGREFLDLGGRTERQAVCRDPRRWRGL